MTAPANQKKRLLLIDGHSMAFRAFYALPAENFSTSGGQHTNAVYGFTSMLINVLRDEEPTHVAVADSQPDARRQRAMHHTSNTSKCAPRRALSNGIVFMCVQRLWRALWSILSKKIG